MSYQRGLSFSQYNCFYITMDSADTKLICQASYAPNKIVA